MIIKKYRKKPVIIEAYISEEELIIHTLEGDMKANKGDYIITGINGEKYPCKPDIFIKTYEEVWIYLLFVFVLMDFHWLFSEDIICSIFLTNKLSTDSSSLLYGAEEVK